jgi:hypothetical protein
MTCELSVAADSKDFGGNTGTKLFGSGAGTPSNLSGGFIIFY